MIVAGAQSGLLGAFPITVRSGQAVSAFGLRTYRAAPGSVRDHDAAWGGTITAAP